jgi:hypothetical protein
MNIPYEVLVRSFILDNEHTVQHRAITFFYVAQHYVTYVLYPDPSHNSVCK